MKTVVTTILATTLLSATPVLANNIEGHRVGLGFLTSNIEEVPFDYDYSTKGFKLEYGYDINRIFGLNLSYAKGSGSYASPVDTDTSSFKIDTDIGYTFIFNNFNIKPYGALGWTKFSEDISVLGHDVYDWNDSSLFLGAGARAQFGDHFYTDFRMDFMNMKDAGDDVFIDQFSLTVGYKF
ncbi:porin family protein [Vibrio sp. NTOU-M3]|uniref:porin family protein n=1 Tax=Vibrio sp. NTOU-M3 TaxID=3234954 RepID=UPI00349F68D0